MQKTHLIHSKFKHYGIFVCALGALFYCYEYLLRIAPGVMVPELMQSFHIGAEGIGWLVGMYYYAYTPMQAAVGISTDYLGPRKVLVTALVLCSVGSLFFGLSDNVIIAAFGRLLVGMGSAFAFVCAMKLASMWLPQKYFALFAGLTTAMGMLGGMFGNIGMQYAVEAFGWHEVLIMGAVIGAILIPLFWFSVVERNPILSPHHRMSDSLNGLLTGFLKMFRNPQMWMSGIIGCMMYLSLSAFAEIWGVPFLASFNNITHQEAADLNSMVFFGWLIGSPFSGLLSTYLKSRRIPLIVGNLLAALCILILLFVKFDQSWAIGSLLFFFGFFASNEIQCFAVANESIPLSQAATAIGFINMLIMMGGMVMQPLVGHILDFVWGGTYLNGIRVYSTLDFHKALIIIPVAMIFAAILSMRLKETYSARSL